MRLDLMPMIKEETYEQTYAAYIDLFKTIATAPRREQIIVEHAPWSWYPILYHLRCIVTHSRRLFPHCALVESAAQHPLSRTAVEVLSSFRPETADALFKCDAQWETERARQYRHEGEFIVTTNGAFYRSEIAKYMHHFRDYEPTKRKVVLVPCSADKPYPSPLHQAVLNLMPDDYYLMNTTGALGLIPQDLWDVMPHYDAGIPNHYRVLDTIINYFGQFEHDHVIVYCDFYAQVIGRAFKVLDQLEKVSFGVRPVHRTDYVDLTDPILLAWLAEAFV